MPNSIIKGFSASASAHASNHTDGTDDIQNATDSQKGLATATQIGKLDGISSGADVTGSNAPQAHKDSHDPDDGSDALDCATPAELASVQASAEGSAHTFARSDHAHQIQHSIADNHIVTIDDADVEDNDFAKFTANGLEGRNYAEVRTDLGIDYDYILIPAKAWIASETNGCGEETIEVGSTNKKTYAVLSFDKDSDEYAECDIPWQDNWDTSHIKFKVFWKPKSDAGAAETVEFELSLLAQTDSDAIDTAQGSSQAVTDTWLADDDYHISPASSVITAGGSLAAEDGLHLMLMRDVSADDLADDACIIMVVLEIKKTGTITAWS